MKNLTFLPALLAAAPDPGLKSVIQIAIACRDIEATSRQWAAALGVDPPKVRLTRPGREVNVVYRGRPSDGRIKMAVMEPGGPDTSWREFLEAHGAGVQHIAFGVADLDKTVKRFEGLGMPVVHRGPLRCRQRHLHLPRQQARPGRHGGTAPLGPPETVIGLQ